MFPSNVLLFYEEESLNIIARGFVLCLVNKHDNKLTDGLSLLDNGYSEPISPGIKRQGH